MNTFTETELQDILMEIEQLLQEFKRLDYAPLRGDELPPKQQQVIEQATGEKATSFWQRFIQVAYQDLCEEGGVLYEQWQAWGDLNKKTVVNTFNTLLIGMGIVGIKLRIVLVPLVAWVLYIGIKTICAGKN